MVILFSHVSMGSHIESAIKHWSHKYFLANGTHTLWGFGSDLSLILVSPIVLLQYAISAPLSRTRQVSRSRPKYEKTANKTGHQANMTSAPTRLHFVLQFPKFAHCHSVSYDIPGYLHIFHQLKTRTSSIASPFINLVTIHCSSILSLFPNCSKLSGPFYLSTLYLGLAILGAFFLQSVHARNGQILAYFC